MDEAVSAEGKLESLVNSSVLSPWEPNVFSMVIFGLMVMLLIGLLLFIASWLGEQKPDTEKLT